MKNKDMEQYYYIVEDILNNKEFQRMETIPHHGGNRLEHLIRVSYYSYKISKIFDLDCESVARGALLHDFFFDNTRDLTIKDRCRLLINHPKYVWENSRKQFSLSEKEEDIILSHMFPIGIRLPRYFESWIVDFVDDFSAIYEKISSKYRKLKLILNNL